jgi:hypothetical protein
MRTNRASRGTPDVVLDSLDGRALPLGIIVQLIQVIQRLLVEVSCDFEIFILPLLLVSVLQVLTLTVI